MSDLEKFKNGEDSKSKNKSYESVIGELRLFSVQSMLLKTQILRLIKEINTHKQLDKTHRELVLESIVNGLIVRYLAACAYVKKDLNHLIENLYIELQRINGFDTKFFNDSFFELYNYILNDKELFAFYNK